MKLLILGGTQFVGRYIVEAALDRGWDVTLFNRGRTNPALFPDVETLVGDRDGGLGVLRGRSWDAVVDVSGYVPRLVRDSARALAHAVERYTFISTVAVYAHHVRSGQDESSTLALLRDDKSEQVSGETYGALKALAERLAESTLPERVLIVRPGYVVGPGDYTDRFPYWVRRVARGGDVLAPGDPNQQLQCIDVRDLAEWVVDMTARQETGTYNATGPDFRLSWGSLLEHMREVLESDARFTWVSEDFIEKHRLRGNPLPLWTPLVENGLNELIIDRAVYAGLNFRPLEDTILDTLRWDQSRPPVDGKRPGLSPEREADLLQRWRQQVHS